MSLVAERERVPPLRRLALLLSLLGCAACATTVPLQTASTVPKGVVRISGQSTFAVYCGFSDLDRCSTSNSTPEMRLGGRVGLHDRVDLGLSLHAIYPFESEGPRVGALVDGKVELFRSEIAPGRKQVISAGLGAAASWQDQDPRNVTELGVVVPLRWGYQFEVLELFAGGHFLERLAFGVLSGSKPASVPAAGITVGLVTRRRAKLGLALSYEAPLRFFERGAFTLGIGFLYDVGGKHDSDVPIAVPPLPVAGADSG